LKVLRGCPMPNLLEDPRKLQIEGVQSMLRLPPKLKIDFRIHRSEVELVMDVRSHSSFVAKCPDSDNVPSSEIPPLRQNLLRALRDADDAPRLNHAWLFGGAADLVGAGDRRGEFAVALAYVRKKSISIGILTLKQFHQPIERPGAF